MVSGLSQRPNRSTGPAAVHKKNKKNFDSFKAYLIEGLLKVVGLDGQVERHERLLSLVTVRTALGSIL
jgi:hypothetical protein